MMMRNLLSKVLTTTPHKNVKIEALKQIAQELRRQAVLMTHRAGS